jgi:hypothetical protein
LQRHRRRDFSLHLQRVTNGYVQRVNHRFCKTTNWHVNVHTRPGTPPARINA